MRRSLNMNDVLIRQAKRVAQSKSKRQRKKQWNKFISMCGVDSEGLTNYAKAVNIISKYLTTNDKKTLGFK